MDIRVGSETNPLLQPAGPLQGSLGISLDSIISPSFAMIHPKAGMGMGNMKIVIGEGSEIFQN